MIWSTPHYQSTYSRIIPYITILIFGIIGGFFVERFGIMPWRERVSIAMMLGIASISYGAVIKDAKRYGASFLIVSGIIALLFEYIWVQSCIPYGCFHYGDVLGSKILHTVPWTVFVGWTPLIIWVYTVISRYIHNKLLYIPIWAILLTLIDIVLDPWAVWLGFWTFGAGGWYYNVPRSNFGGWMISWSIAMLLISLFIQPRKTNISRTYSAALTLSFFTFVALFRHMRLAGLLWIALLTAYRYFLYTQIKR